MLAGIGTASMGKIWLDLTYGVIGGFGMGMGYDTPVAMVTKWFPDRRVFGSGMVVMGFGLGAFIYNQIVTRIAPFAAAAAANSGTAFNPVNICNGLGRFFWGWVSDRLGRNMTYTVMYLIQVVIFVLLARTHSFTAVVLEFAIVLLCYGGGFGVMPSFNADYFGTRFVGQNYGMILTAWGVAGIVGPFIAATVKDRTGSFTGALIPVAIMLLVAAIIPFFIHKPQERTTAASAV